MFYRKMGSVAIEGVERLTLFQSGQPEQLDVVPVECPWSLEQILAENFPIIMEE